LTLKNGIINAVANFSSPITKAVRYCHTNGTNWTGKESACGKNNIQWRSKFNIVI